jgi:uncharacterized cofD-like protein
MESAQKARRKNIVVIGGGTGTFTVLSGLKRYSNVNLSAIVSMADDGGSTGVLREEFGILPPGSVRPALVALAPYSEKALADLFQFRFTEGVFRGHNFGNLFITALSQTYGNFEKAIEEAGKILHIRGSVIPSTLDDARLCAKLENGEIVRGETNIDVPKHDGNLRIQNVWLEPSCKANPRAIAAIRRADLIVIGPGDLFSSLLPNLLVRGIPEAIKKSKAKKVYICNMMTKFGETNGFSGSDFVDTIEHYLGRDVLDFIIFNTKQPQKERVAKYEREKAQFVRFDKRDFRGRKFRIISGNFLRPKGFIRHDSAKLAKVLIGIA